MTAIPHPLQSTALARPDHVVLHAKNHVWTARGLRDASVARAAQLAAHFQLQPGDVVGLAAAPSVDWVIHWHALSWLGCTVLLLPHHEAPATWRSTLQAQGTKALLTDRDIKTVDAGCRALALNTRLPDGPAAEERFWPLDEVRAIVLTSGTTGTPRAVPLTTAQLLFSAMGSAIRLGHHLDDRWLACLPFHHVGGLSMIVRCTWLGITLVLHERFDPARVAAALDRGDATLVSLVPVMLASVLDARDAVPFPPTLRVVLLGGAPTSRSLRARCEALQVPVAITWGMSEAASQVATRLVDGINLAVRADSGPVMPFARVSTPDGRLHIHGPLVASGVLPTQDMGQVDDVGRVTILGRADDVIISGGENIMPREIEEVLRTHPAVDDVAVLGREDATWGQRPIAFIVWRDDRAGEEDATLRAWCRERMARFKVPDAFMTRATLPRNALGKLDRHALRAALEVAS